jgi:excisionase family DNA binding protein
MTHDPEAILTLSDVAGYLKISPSTAWRWCKQGRIPGFQIGRSWRVKQCDLDVLIDQSKLAHPANTAHVFTLHHEPI